MQTNGFALPYLLQNAIGSHSGLPLTRPERRQVRHMVAQCIPESRIAG